MKQSILYALFSALITAAFVTGVPAFAQAPGGETQVSIVHTADLDLTTSTGQRQFDRRLARAAREVCGAASDADLEGSNDVRHCRDEVLARAAEQRDQLIATASRGAIIAITATR